MEFNMEGDHGGMDLSKYLPESTSFMKDLHFKGTEAIYVDNKNAEAPEATEIESDDGSFKMVMKFDDDIEDITYTDFKKKKLMEQTGFMGKQFLITGELPKIKWKISNEKVKFLEYECMKATATIDSNEVVAWFTSQVPMQIGPREYGMLPGAVLMVSVNDGKTEIMATEVKLGTPDFKIEAPSKGKKVTKEEYEKIVEEKTKELRQQSGGNQIIIRG